LRAAITHRLHRRRRCRPRRSLFVWPEQRCARSETLSSSPQRKAQLGVKGLRVRGSTFRRSFPSLAGARRCPVSSCGHEFRPPAKVALASSSSVDPSEYPISTLAKLLSPPPRALTSQTAFSSAMTAPALQTPSPPLAPATAHGWPPHRVHSQYLSPHRHAVP
jgi:hypothetical protein